MKTQSVLLLLVVVYLTNEIQCKLISSDGQEDLVEEEVKGSDLEYIQVRGRQANDTSTTVKGKTERPKEVTKMGLDSSLHYWCDCIGVACSGHCLLLLLSQKED